MPKLTSEQLAERRKGIGASDIGAIAGLSPWRDPVGILNEKLGFATEEADEIGDARDIGHRLEPVIRQLYIDDQKASLVPCGTVWHPTVPWAFATLDAKIHGARRGLEIKAVGVRMMHEWDESADDGIPHYVRAQAAWQMWCIDLDVIDVSALLGGTRFRVWRIPRDLELERKLVAAGDRFWRVNVAERKAPAITGDDSVRTYLDGMYPPLPVPVLADADDTANVLAIARKNATEEIAKHGAIKDEATHKLIAWLGAKGADVVHGKEWVFKYKPNKSGNRSPWFRWKGEENDA